MKTKLLTLLFIVIFVAPSWKNANAQVYICNGGLVSYTIDGKDSEIWYEDMNNALRSFYFAKHKGLEEDFEFVLSGPSVTWDSEVEDYGYYCRYQIYDEDGALQEVEESGSDSVIIDWELSVDNVESSFFYNGQYTLNDLDDLFFFSTVNPEGMNWKDIKKNILFVYGPTVDYFDGYGYESIVNIGFGSDTLEELPGALWGYYIESFSLCRYGNENARAPFISWWGCNLFGWIIDSSMSTLYACPELTSGPTPSVLIYVADGASYSMFGNGDKQYEITEHFNKGDKFYLSYEDDYGSCYKTYNPFPDGDYSRSWLLSGMDASNVNLYENGAGYFEISQSSDYHITVNLLTNKMTVNKVSSIVVVGDVNNDGSCTSSDVTAIYNYILYNDNSAIVNGDQNDDGEITASDVTAIYNVILGN